MGTSGVDRFWGKTGAEGAYHPAICHMLDSGLVAAELVQRGPLRHSRTLRYAWRGVDEDLLLQWLPLFVALHDIGKISAVFQGQATQSATRVQRDRLIADGVRFPPRLPDLYHAEVSALWINRELARQEPGCDPLTCGVVRDGLNGHHGRYSARSYRELQQRLQYSEQSEPRWADWRATAYQQLRAAIAPAGSLADLGRPRALRAATVALTGLIVWCDWVASRAADFPPAVGTDFATYTAATARRIPAILAEHGLTAIRPVVAYHGFAALFPHTGTPRPLQQQIDQLPAAVLKSPLLAVVEAPTGEGKTEAALALARRIAAGGASDEVFFALPTMATGNQMFTRLEHFYREQYGAGGAVRLIHGQSVLYEPQLRQQITLASDVDAADVAGASAAAALEWYAGPKRAMLAPFGVGTVDQVELAGLQVRHYALRLYGLAGKTVVIDEIHGYDAFMNTILEHTLSWLAGLGSSVILLSATLPLERHTAFAAAYLRGLGATAHVPASHERAYPLLSLYSSEQTLTFPVAAYRPQQQLHLQLVTQLTTDSEADHLLELITDGGALARICNRVDDAQALFSALQARDPQLTTILLHARLPQHERQRREQQIHRLFGRDSERTADQRLVVIGTQVLEQSLDYDVDVMISDFAPIDLLLQRAGRLHRHTRSAGRPPRHQRTLLRVTLPVDASGQPDWRRRQGIYQPLLLWRSWLLLRRLEDSGVIELELPRDYRSLIEAVYSEAFDEQAEAEVPAQARADYQRMRTAYSGQGRQQLIPPVDSADLLSAAAGLEVVEDEAGRVAAWQRARTRPGEQISVVPCYRTPTGFSLDPSGSTTFDMTVAPTLEQQLQLLSHAVPLSSRTLIIAFRAAGDGSPLRWPWPARLIPHLLSPLFPLPLDTGSHSVVVGQRRLRLDPALGLVLEALDDADVDQMEDA